jgi:hypothetical protein
MATSNPYASTASEDPPRRSVALAYGAGEYAAGVATAVLAAAPTHALVGRDWDMVVAMALGMLFGTGAHLLVTGVLGPVVGFFHVMAPGALIGMYGGMLFGMRDSMQPTSWSHALAVAVGFGAVAVAAVQIYDRALRANRRAEPPRRSAP